MLGLIDPKLMPGWEWLADCPKLSPDQLVFVGLRDLDSEEREVIHDLKIKAFTMLKDLMSLLNQVGPISLLLKF